MLPVTAKLTVWLKCGGVPSSIFRHSRLSFCHLRGLSNCVGHTSGFLSQNNEENFSVCEDQ